MRCSYRFSYGIDVAGMDMSSWGGMEVQRFVVDGL